MEEIASGIWQAIKLIGSLDPEVRQIALFSLQVSGLALLAAATAAVPYGIWLAFSRFPGRRVLIGLTYSGMAFPTVVVGLIVFLMLSQQGPFGLLGWLFTPWAIVVAQFIIAFPVIASLTMSAILSINPGMRLQLRSLGATRAQATLASAGRGSGLDGYSVGGGVRAGGDGGRGRDHRGWEHCRKHEGVDDGHSAGDEEGGVRRGDSAGDHPAIDIVHD